MRYSPDDGDRESDALDEISRHTAQELDGSIRSAPVAHVESVKLPFLGEICDNPRRLAVA